MDTALEKLVIKDWSTLTIADFMAIEDINSSHSLNPLEKMIHILAILSGKPDAYFNQFRVPDITELFARMDFLKTPPDAPLREYYSIGGKQYKFLGNLSELSTGQFIDLDAYAKGQTATVDNLHLIVSIFLMPVIRKTWLQRFIEKTGLRKYRDLEHYLETPLAETSENVYQNMLYQDANAICLFFCVVGQLYTAISADCLSKEMKEKLELASTTLSKTSTTDKKIGKALDKIREKIASLQDGIGSFASTVLHPATPSDMNKFTK